MKKRLVELAPTAECNGVQTHDQPVEHTTQHNIDRPILTQLSTVKASPVEWLWPGWIPRGAVTLLEGDPGLGKSIITCDIAARVSRGWLMPPEGGPVEGAEPGGVLMLSAEDDLARTIQPRLKAAEADLNRIWFLGAIATKDDSRPPVLPWDLDLVRSMILESEISAVTIDPFMAYLDAKVDAHRDQDVRRCLHALKILAEETRAALVIVRHLNKLSGGPAIYRGGGSIGIIGAVRSALVVGTDPSNDRVHVLASNKCNLGPTPRSLTYQLERVGDVARVAWGEESDLKADDILAHPVGQKKQTVGQQCGEAIADILADGRVIESTDLDEQLAERGFSANSIRQGRRLAGVRCSRMGFGANYLVALDEAPMLGCPRPEQSENPQA
jgi:hypothetical protein